MDDKLANFVKNQQSHITSESTKDIENIYCLLKSQSQSSQSHVSRFFIMQWFIHASESQDTLFDWFENSIYMYPHKNLPIKGGSFFYFEETKWACWLTHGRKNEFFKAYAYISLQRYKLERIIKLRTCMLLYLLKVLKQTGQENWVGPIRIWEGVGIQYWPLLSLLILHAPSPPTESSSSSSPPPVPSWW